MANILLVDDDSSFSSATVSILEALGFQAETAATVAEAKALLANNTYDRVLLDLMLPDGSGFHILEDIPLDSGKTKVTIISGNASVNKHVMSLYGTHINYLVKPITLEQLKQLLAVDEEDNGSAEFTRHFGCLVGESEAMQKLYAMIKRVAASEANVMLFGESGVGKEEVAKAVHFAAKCTGELVATNCGAFSSELLGSELFGHEKGAFTGANNKRAGLFERAVNGTLFLDEITEMPLSEQPTLLRVLESKTVTRLGGSDALPVNCRVISATNRSEQALVETHCLREDIYFRLAVFPITIPPLRNRREDIPLLANFFLTSLNLENGTQYQLSEKDLDRLQQFDWPGNVRELRHTIHRAFIMSSPDDDTLAVPEDIGSPFSKKSSASPLTDSFSAVGRTIEEVEKELIMKTLDEYDQNKTKAAEVLGVSVKTLYNRLNSYEEIETANE